MDKFMDFMDDFVFGPLNLITRAEGIVKQKVYQDTAVKFSILRIDKGGVHTQNDVKRVLKKYRISSFGYTHDSQCIHFLIKSRQAAWAEYLLLHAGIRLQNPPVNPKNYEYVKQHPLGWMPLAWADQEEDNDTDREANQVYPDDNEQSFGLRGSLDQIANWIDSL